MRYDGSRECAAEVAEMICGLFRSGASDARWTANRISFEMSDIARCSEFTRECVEAAMGCGNFGSGLFGGTARETERILVSKGKRVETPLRGHIVCFNRGGGEWGHIGLCLGDGQFAENTSSTSRGPGFVISKLSDMRGRISGYYSVLPARAKASPPTQEIKVVSVATGRILHTFELAPNGNHVADQSKIYVEE